MTHDEPDRAPLPEAALQQVARRFRVLGDVERLRILQALLDGERSVGELVARSERSQANVSTHLGLLRSEGLVEARREGTRKVYRVADPAVEALCRLVCTSIEARRSRQLDALQEE